MGRKLAEEEIVVLQTKRKELVYRGLAVLWILIIAVVGMILLEMNDVAWSDSNRFRVISLTLIAGLYGGYVVPLQKYPKFLRDYPDIVREKPWKYPLPAQWHVLRILILIGGIAVLLFAFMSSNKPQPKPFNSDTVENIQPPVTPVIPNEVEEIIDDMVESSQ